MRSVLLCLLSSSVLITSTVAARTSDPLQTGHDRSTHRELSGFEENKGQVRTASGDPASFARFRLSQGNTTVFLLNSGIAYQFTRTHYPQGYAELMGDPVRDQEEESELEAMRAQMRTETYRMDMVLEHADPNARITTDGRSTDHTNFYTHDVLGVHSYSRVTYHDVYPGIDWVLYTGTHGLKYEFVVHPGADPARIQLRFKHQETLQVDADGRLIIGNRMGRISEEPPVSFQDGTVITTRFEVKDQLIVFNVNAFDPQRTLIIDPSVTWATYYGGTGDDYGYATCLDASGNVFLAGPTTSIQAIAVGGHQSVIGGGYDAFLVKFNADGVRQWGTYYGGEGNDYAAACTADLNGNVFVAGYTDSHMGIAFNGHQNMWAGDRDAFLVKFNANGIRQWGTYYGGADMDQGHGCAVDAGGKVYLAGKTECDSVIAINGHDNTFGGLHDAFLAKFDADGARIWATYCGAAGYDEGYGTAVDPDGNVYLAGWTHSWEGIAVNGHQNALSLDGDGFLVKYDQSGVRQWGTYYGNVDNDNGYKCAVDPSGNVFLAGWTDSYAGIASSGHQNTFGGYIDAFLVKFEPDGTRLWATYYGGIGAEFGRYCATDLEGNVYLVGETSSNSAIAADGYQNTFGGYKDAYMAKFAPDGTRIWGTYYGAETWDEGWSCAVGATGEIYVAGMTVSTAGIAVNGHQTSFGGGVFDGFLVRFEDGISTGINGPEGDPATTAVLSDGSLQITTSSIGDRYTLLDALGRTVREGRLSTSTLLMDLTSEPGGLYLFKVWDQGGSEALRILKE